MYQTQQELVRLLKQQLLAIQIKTITCLVLGITSIIATPLIAKDTESYRDRIINALSFTLGILTFSYALILTKPLQVLNGKTRMIEELEKELFIGESCMFFNQLKNHHLQPAIDVTSVTSTSTYTPEVEVAETPTTANFPTSTNTSTNTSLTDDEILKQILLAMESGQSDTYIIENILGYKGRNFAKGKDVLDAYKALLRG